MPIEHMPQTNVVINADVDIEVLSNNVTLSFSLPEAQSLIET
jgi:hypothetical protein